MACDTPDDHPPIETWSLGRGVHTTTRRDCCRPERFAAEGAYPPGSYDDPEDRD